MIEQRSTNTGADQGATMRAEQQEAEVVLALLQVPLGSVSAAGCHSPSLQLPAG